jgi:hypothetical protein
MKPISCMPWSSTAGDTGSLVEPLPCCRDKHEARPQPGVVIGTSLKKSLTDMRLGPILSGFQRRGHSSAGRAPAWHAGGRRFDPAWLHQLELSPSSRGLGHHPFTVATGVRIPVGTPSWLAKLENVCGAVVQLVRMLACHAGGRGFESRPLRHSTENPPCAGFLLSGIKRTTPVTRSLPRLDRSD